MVGAPFSVEPIRAHADFDAIALNSKRKSLLMQVDPEHQSSRPEAVSYGAVVVVVAGGGVNGGRRRHKRPEYHHRYLIRLNDRFWREIAGMPIRLCCLLPQVKQTI